MINKLGAEVTNDEVRGAVFGMNPWKAPGLDGFPAGFYQNSWDTVGGVVCDFVREVWREPSRVAMVNQTDICLIPKGGAARAMSPFQTGFVLGRNIHENIVVANEMVHSMHMINVIMHSVTSVETNVKWHGARADYFRPQRGIRQGDPISPYIFVLCMYKLSHLITQAVEEGRWKTLRAGRNGPMVSHLMFADDLLLFGEANDRQMTCVIESLNEFCRMSGQEISHSKTSILFSKNVHRDTRHNLVRMSGFRETEQLGKYLGVPLTGRAPKREDFQYIIDQVNDKLASWKAQLLSFAGRVTLAKSVIEAIPIYPMMTNRIPKGCLEEIQKLQRKFIWGERDDARRYHAVNWDEVTKPKCLGGLGLRHLHTMNQACILKLGWKLASGDNDLWCEVMRG
ncbi:putative ribonuclease H protein, partial [Trifolium medium]|nr:putative ribonuclease H protein [Trifolium medium]